MLQKEENLLQKIQKIIIVNDKNNRKIKRKIVKIYQADSVEQLKNTLKRKFKYVYPKNLENSNKIEVIEFKYNIFRKILLVILVIAIFILGISFVNKTIKNINDKKVVNQISELEKEKISYVFIEINPQFVLTIKNNIVQDIACLNADCMIFYNEIDIKGKSINVSIDNLYNLSKEKGFIVSGGVKIKTTEQLNIDDKDYIIVEYIDNDTKNELLSNVKNNEDIKNNSNEDYYEKLWEELKKDSDYDKIYTCNMNNEVLECFIKPEMFIIDESDYTYASLPFYI